MENKDLNTLPEETGDIFGPSLSREEIKKAVKEQRRAERQALRDAAKARREANKAERAASGKRTDLLVVGAIVAGLVLIAGGLLALQIFQDTKAEKYEMDEENEGYFLDEDAKPELSEEGLTAAVNEVYYTKGGYLCVRMTLGNGLDKPQHMSALEVKISNGDTEELIASGYTAKVSKDYVVAPQGYNTYRFYISPGFVKIKDDSLYSLSYSITASGYFEED